MKKILILSFILFFSACGNKIQKQMVTIGKTTFDELRTLMGEPKRIDQGSSETQKVAVYSEDQKFQLEKNVVVAEFRAPLEIEKSLLYWKHFCRDEETTIRDLPVKNESHQRPEQEFSCKKSMVTVIYDPNVDKITRVINYAP